MKNNRTNGEKEIADIKTVTIACKAPEATAICVAGEFNAWDPGVNPMKRNQDGTWKLRIKLPVGRCEYKFIVDGEWCCEPGCSGEHQCQNCVPNDMGTMNRTVEVE